MSLLSDPEACEPQTSRLWLSLGTNLSSTRGAASETPALPGDPVARLALVALEPDFCVLERAGTRAALNQTDEMDEIRNSRRAYARAIARLVEVVLCGHQRGGLVGFCSLRRSRRRELLSARALVRGAAVGNARPLG
ncbi:MAG: hypothetical protein ACLP4R_23730, partial [Solirubrobacteraceae bacterium]